jgi:hypothetical protein
MLTDHEKISGPEATGASLGPGETRRQARYERRLIEDVRGQKIYMDAELRMDLLIWSKKRRLSVSRIVTAILRRHVPEYEVSRRRYTGLSEPEGPEATLPAAA